ncbi:MAG: hypothetical protein E8D46_15465 [Nitrospira sp.]|jgi:hypothetical protein|nr:MAG: hypothetical protein E8D46_15465 [Nitrospira sp.]
MPITPQDIAHLRQINLIAYLENLGHQPAPGQHKPHHALYHSPLRKDRNPSFSVSFVNGAWLWYDFAQPDHHGDIIDFVQAYFHLEFKEAVERLLRSGNAPAPQKTAPATPSPQSETERALHARKLYHHAKANMTAHREEELRAYFEMYRLPYYAHLGAVWLPLGELNLPYIAFPLPSPNVHFMQGLMCRALRDTPDDYRRRFRGNRSPWIMRRRDAPILITESIMDCLSSDVLFGPVFTLCALNGLPKPESVWPFLERLKPKIIYLALDNDLPSDDPKIKKGPELQRELVDLLSTKGIHTMDVQVHHQAGVKDLHRLWLQQPTRISGYHLSRSGIHHPAQSTS